MPILHLDWETRSAEDLRKVGLDRYAHGSTTDILCGAYAFDDEPVKLWLPGQAIPSGPKEHIMRGGEVHGHNVQFEISICNNIGTKYGWPELKASQTVCTMAMAYAMGLPGSLDGCAAALGITERKDEAGGRLMLQMSKPRKSHICGPCKGTGIERYIEDIDGELVGIACFYCWGKGTGDQYIWWEDEERLKRLYAYCIQDVVVERAAGKRMLKLSPYEKKIWLLDQKINNRGITVDTAVVERAIEVVEAEKIRLNAEMRLISDNEISTCQSLAQMKNFLEFYGIPGEALDKAAVTDYLARTDIQPKARKILELRAEAGKASTAKFAPMLHSADPQDRRIRGCFQYSAAHTRRWGGRRVQLHNLKRSTIKYSTIEAIIEDLKKGIHHEALALYYGSPLSILGDCTRSFLTASPGHELLVADFSSIEARVLAWLAGQEDVLNVFRQGQDIYTVAAAQIFGCSASEITKEDPRRQIGKVAILALGYGGGVGAFQTMAKGYGVRMQPAFQHLVSVANADQLQKAKDNWKLNGSRYEIPYEEFIASDLTKIFWRENNQQIVRYWYEVEQCAISAVLNPMKAYPVSQGNVTFKKAGSFLWCQLPGGGVICYPYPEIKQVKTPWGELKHALTYMAEEQQQWRRFTTYGGSLVENIDQSVSRDLLADAMLRLDDAGYNICAHVHDEIICDEVKDTVNLQDMIRIMVENPAWASKLPIAASGFKSFRYRK